MSKFTPGPWRWDSLDTPFQLVNGECIGGEDTGIREVYQEDGTLPIATCYAIDGLNNTENARLIAAAPDLYEALVRIAELSEDDSDPSLTSEDSFGNADDVFHDGKRQQRYESAVIARAALAKANGEVTA